MAIISVLLTYLIKYILSIMTERPVLRETDLKNIVPGVKEELKFDFQFNTGTTIEQ